MEIEPGRQAVTEQDPATTRLSAGSPGVVAVYLTNGTRTSQGPGPGVKRLPPDEAGRLVSARLAAFGEAPPRGYADGGCDGRDIALMMPRSG
jgi:hypothetical protein